MCVGEGAEGSACTALAAPPGTSPGAATGRGSPFPASGSCGGRGLEAGPVHGALCPLPGDRRVMVLSPSESGGGPTAPWVGGNPTGWIQSRP